MAEVQVQYHNIIININKDLPYSCLCGSSFSCKDTTGSKCVSSFNINGIGRWIKSLKTSKPSCISIVLPLKAYKTQDQTHTESVWSFTTSISFTHADTYISWALKRFTKKLVGFIWLSNT